MEADFDSASSSDYSLLGRMYKSRSLPGVDCVQLPVDLEVRHLCNNNAISIVCHQGGPIPGGRAGLGQRCRERLLARPRHGERRGDRGYSRGWKIWK